MLKQPLIEKILAHSAAKIDFDIRRCLRSRFNKNSCASCLDTCSDNALELHGRQIIFDAEKCSSCMQCTSVCPNDAFEHSIDLVALIQVLAEKETTLLSCQKRIHNQNHITIPCIGFFSESMLAVMNSVARQNCFIDVSPCGECANGNCLNTLHDNMQKMIIKMRGNGKIRLKCLFDKEPGLPAAEKTERRSFLRLFGNTISDLGKEAIGIEPADPDETKDPYRKGQVKSSVALQYALSVLPDERTYERDMLLSYFSSLSTNEECDCCPSCTGMCPTGALKRKKEDDKKYLTFTSASCSGCGLCVHFCRKSALTLKNGFSGDPNITLEITDKM